MFYNGCYYYYYYHGDAQIDDAGLILSIPL